MKSNQNIPLKSILKKLSVLRKPVLLILLLLCAYLLGYGIGYLTSDNFRTLPGSSSVQSASGGASSGNWGLSFQEEGQCPQGNASIEELAEYNAYYAQDTEEKVLYLTFDAGYENGNTETILNALKKHNVSATFFVVGTYIESEPELIQRMIDEGHTVGNHTWHHPNMSGIESMEEFKKELTAVEDAFRQTTGQEMTKYYRPPQGIYSESNLEMAKELGYQTFFWSLAYVDWYADDQPTKEEAFDKLLGRIHPGAIVLLHSTSSTNAEILDELLTKWEEMGYQVRPLSELVE
ncbi:MAG TPA: polysaccharide deacetylase family protein [Candidatus Mediterraneibacter vanvlietii]|nr:polysaccharide deacetylase family protein [Candidatus Mediterraneibacter vanvlietii]